ncbi:MAG: crossover junction endodeoxyribonuclease RuvC [Opitutales bacterium]|jgi:crossover junction endodeoxyribonuclease RuvC
MSQSTRKLWAAKLDGRLKPSAAQVPVIKPRRFEGIVLGVDPSLRGTGLAVLDVRGGDWTLLYSRTLKHKASMEMSACLGEIHKGVAEAIERFKPVHCALEQTIYVQNSRTALVMGAARGAAISAMALAGLPVNEYPPRRVKQAVSGYGAASKEQVAGQIQAMLKLPEALPPDESDAAAVCICHALHGSDAQDA